MKKKNFIIFILFFTILILMNPPLVEADNGFCTGYQDGYAAGWCYQDNFCIEPIPPICPIPKIGENGYQDGYNRGFLDGLRARSKRRY
ncbi:MAG: hypothetical protein ABH872_00905 [Candidatus Omnitrophota bacterium]